jgi:choline dehydrogenase-like flavoprotein
MSYYLTTASDTREYCTDTADMAGCILGGGTVVNALMFVRPQDADFNDKWPTGWKWTDVSPSADRLYERNPGTTLASADGKRYDQSVSIRSCLHLTLLILLKGIQRPFILLHKHWLESNRCYRVA